MDLSWKFHKNSLRGKGVMIKKSSLPSIFLLGFLMRTRFLPTVVLRGRVKYFAMAKIKTMENCLDACAVETAKLVFVYLDNLCLFAAFLGLYLVTSKPIIIFKIAWLRNCTRFLVVNSVKLLSSKCFVTKWSKHPLKISFLYFVLFSQLMTTQKMRLETGTNSTNKFKSCKM